MAFSPKSDPQRGRLYRMEEREFNGHARHTLAETHLRNGLKALCRRLKISAPKLAIRRIDKSNVCGAYSPSLCLIELHPKMGKNAWTLAHELAHHVIAVHDPKNQFQDHGPEFVHVFVILLDVMRLVPRIAMEPVLRKYRLQSQPIPVSARPTQKKPRTRKARSASL